MGSIDPNHATHLASKATRAVAFLVAMRHDADSAAGLDDDQWDSIAETLGEREPFGRAARAQALVFLAALPALTALTMETHDQ
jgi:hypothetical protein